MNADSTGLSAFIRVHLRFQLFYVAGAASSFFSPSAPAAAGAALGLPGLGRRSDLCSTPLFFSSDDTVSLGTAPTLSQYWQRSSLATNCLAWSLLRGS